MSKAVHKKLAQWCENVLLQGESRRINNMRRAPVFEELEPRILMSTFTVAPTPDAEIVELVC